MTTFSLRPCAVSVGTDFFLVENLGNRQIITEVTMEATTGKETIKSMTESDYIMVKNKSTDTLIELVKSDKNSYLVIKGNKHRVSFLSINQETIQTKKLCDDQNSAIEQRKDLARVAREAADEASQQRKILRESNKIHKTSGSKKEKLENIKLRLAKRVTTLQEDLDEANQQLKKVESELAEFTEGETVES